MKSVGLSVSESIKNQNTMINDHIRLLSGPIPSERRDAQSCLKFTGKCLICLKNNSELGSIYPEGDAYRRLLCEICCASRYALLSEIKISQSRYLLTNVGVNFKPNLRELCDMEESCFYRCPKLCSYEAAKEYGKPVFYECNFEGLYKNS